MKGGLDEESPVSDVQGRAAVRPGCKRDKADSRSVSGRWVGDGRWAGGADRFVLLNGVLLRKRGRGIGQDTQQVAQRCMRASVRARIVAAIVRLLGLRAECHGHTGGGTHKQGE